MINFNFENDFRLENEEVISNWISKVIEQEKCNLGEINYIFCDDDYLHKLNVEFLNHDTLTDIISFDYAIGKTLHGDIFISTERVLDNASDFGVSFEDELNRVMIHGILHFCGYKDKSDSDSKLMRQKEDESLALLDSIR